MISSKMYVDPRNILEVHIEKLKARNIIAKDGKTDISIFYLNKDAIPLFRYMLTIRYNIGL